MHLQHRNQILIGALLEYMMMDRFTLPDRLHSMIQPLQIEELHGVSIMAQIGIVN